MFYFSYMQKHKLDCTILKHLTFLVDAGQNRAEEEDAQLEERSWNCVLWAVTSCVELSSWNFVHCHGAGAAQIFTRRIEASAWTINPHTAGWVLITHGGKSLQHTAKWPTGWHWTTIPANACVFPYSSSGPRRFTPTRYKYRFWLNTSWIYFMWPCHGLTTLQWGVPRLLPKTAQLPHDCVIKL